MQRANSDKSELLSPTALLAAEVDTLATAVKEAPRHPALEAARAKWRDCRAALDVAEKEFIAGARFDRNIDNGLMPDRPTRALIAKRDRAAAALEEASSAVESERDAAHKAIAAHLRRHAPECAEVMSEVAVILETLGRAMLEANSAAERDGGAGHIVFGRAPTLLAMARALSV